ncbi:hypothetical protein COL5a_009976 [Colletotrichum fioriniae]|uniref:uncharacterized protein n=1 Tax=Colletotrichum fioriniae TaxID=710243 RepID=UPI0023011B9B|nr:uncharacterized protein COL516b_007189 [Colletotrichum fioriniae]KAJ0302139.1 hypothetical protein COL516b_007189 [Colletotrichum fioriniae]KAJ0319800.1 hypothetical protein COL5a_009976 [Colletotrichum fioriniae]KAJ3950366.1 hypothetical protein N0V96_001510 [Colletotrichum fioriniae]
MAQPQPQMPQRAFSPPQPTPSPAATQAGFAPPPNKRPRLSPGATPQPESPYSTSPYAPSPGAPVTPSTAATSAASPVYPNAQQQQQQQAATPTYTGPYQHTNGNTTPALALPSAPTPPPQVSTPQPPAPPTLPQYTSATSALSNNNSPSTPIMQQPSTPGAMGPPSRPPDRPQKEYEYDVTDSLAGTGIDLRAEEQFLSELYVPESRTGFAPYPQGNKGSFYGAGPANQPAQPAGTDTQNQLVAQAAEKAWQESAKRLAQTRTMELNNAFLQVPVVYRKAEKFARDQGLILNLETKNSNQPMGRMRLPEEFPAPTVTVTTKKGPDSTMVTTTGTWIPQEAFLVDQLALLSLATKQRLRTLMEDSNRIAKNRQTSSHGEVPEEWQVAAAPLKSAPETQTEDETQQSATENGASPRPSAQKRPLEDASSSQASKVQKISATNTMSHTVREVGKAERDWEERRLRKRNARKDGTAEVASTPSRAGSVAPGTPGGSAPDSEKAISKKEQKKLDAVKKAEASSHANQNITSSMFVGMPKTGSLFGKKKGGKSYSWMTGGSGASTPRLGTPGKSGAAAASGPPPPANHALTVEGRARLGNWREDKEKGKGIQVRDWVAALEGDEIELRAMQAAYDKLDTSEPK